MLIVLPTSDEVSATGLMRWVQSRDGTTPAGQGQDALSLLPPQTDVTLAVPAPLLSWHRVNLPATGSARIRQVLDGLLEDRVLTDPGELHFALEPGLAPRQTGWVAACHKAWLTGWIDALQATGRRVVRILPETTPQTPAWQGAVHTLGQTWWLQTNATGVLCHPLGKTSSSPSVPTRLAPVWADVPVCADPALVTMAEAWSGQTATVQTTGDRLLAQAALGWDLAQFDLRQSAGVRQGQRLVSAARAAAFAPAWRGFRWGVLATVLLGTVGLWAAAWQSQRQMDAQGQAVKQVLTQTFPHITLVLDAPLQMQREVQRLQRAHGMAGAADLERFLMDMAASSPQIGNLKSLGLENQTFTFTLGNPPAEATQALQAGLQQRGWTVEAGSTPSTPWRVRRGALSAGARGSKP